MFEGARNASLLSKSKRSLGFDFHGTHLPCLPMTEAAPNPVSGIVHESACDRVVMNVMQLLFPFAIGDDVEVVITSLPEWLASSSVGKFARDRLLQNLECSGKSAVVGFADQQMHVFRHHDISEDVELIPTSSSFEFLLEDPTAGRCMEQKSPPITTESEKVIAAGLLIALETRRHSEEDNGNDRRKDVTSVVAGGLHPSNSLVDWTTRPSSIMLSKTWY